MSKGSKRDDVQPRAGCSNSNSDSDQMIAHIAEMIYTDMLPVSFVNGLGVRAFLQNHFSDCQIPETVDVTKRIRALYNKQQRKIQQELNALDCVAFTTECWTSRNLETFITISAHGINSDWQWTSYMLQTRVFSKNHSKEHINIILNEVMGMWNLESKVVVTVHNIICEKTWCNGYEKIVYSFPHLMHFIISKALEVPSIKRLLCKSNMIIEYIKWIPTIKYRQRLKKDQSQLNKWQLTLFNARSLLKHRHIASDLVVCNNASEGRVLALTEEEWRILKKLVSYLKYFDSVDSMVPFTPNQPISVVYPTVKNILQNFVQGEQDDSADLLILKCVLESRLRNCFNLPLNLTDVKQHASVFDVATFLDPRHKSFERAIGMRGKIKKFIERAYRETFMDNEPSCTVAIELDMYAAEQVESSCCPLKWWSDNQARYSVLARMARRFLCIPATSLSYRLTELPAVADCSSANLKYVDQLIFLHYNKKND